MKLRVNPGTRAGEPAKLTLNSWTQALEILPFPWWNLSEYSVDGRPVIAVGKPISTAERWRSHQENGKISNGGSPKAGQGL